MERYVLRYCLLCLVITVLFIYIRIYHTDRVIPILKGAIINLPVSQKPEKETCVAFEGMKMCRTDSHCLTRDYGPFNSTIDEEKRIRMQQRNRAVEDHYSGFDGSRLHCRIPKNMNTMFIALLCYLHKHFGPEVHFADFKVPYGQHDRICYDQNEEMTNNYRRYKAAVNSNSSSSANVTKLVIVRDPLSRFMSAFLDKCFRRNPEETTRYYPVCNRCSKKIACVLHYYVTALKGHGKMTDHHFWPQVWYCNFSEHNDTIHIKYDRTSQFYNELLHALRRSGATEEQLHRIGSELRGQRSHHSTFDRVDEVKRYRSEILSDREAYADLLRGYSVDYEAFGFPIPCPQFSSTTDTD